MDTRIDSFFVKKKNSVSNNVKSSGSTKSEIEKSSEWQCCREKESEISKDGVELVFDRLLSLSRSISDSTGCTLKEPINQTTE